MKHSKPGELFNAHKAKMEKKAKRKEMKLNPPSKGHAPKGAHGRAAVKALGRTKTTGNFKKIEAAKGKGAAIMAYQNALKAHKAGKGKRKTKKAKHSAAALKGLKAFVAEESKEKRMKCKRHGEMACKRCKRHK